MRTGLVALALFALAGCATVDMPLDLDEDGLLSNEEAEWGTDPLDPDSDGDGHLDGAEVAGGFDPSDSMSHPYTGGWPTDPGCREGHVAEGNEVGDLTGEFFGDDQYGDRFASLDFCGKVLLVEVGAFW